MGPNSLMVVYVDPLGICFSGPGGGSGLGQEIWLKLVRTRVRSISLSSCSVL